MELLTEIHVCVTQLSDLTHVKIQWQLYIASATDISMMGVGSPGLMF